MENCCEACYVTTKVTKIFCMSFCGLLAVAFFGFTMTGLVFLATSPDCGYKNERKAEACGYSFIFLMFFNAVSIFLCIAVMYTCYHGYCSKPYRKCCIPSRRCLGPGCNPLVESKDSEECTPAMCWCCLAYTLFIWIQPCVCTCVAGEETLKTFFQSADYVTASSAQAACAREARR